jgi:hypothetical protein
MKSFNPKVSLYMDVLFFLREAERILKGENNICIDDGKLK